MVAAQGIPFGVGAVDLTAFADVGDGLVDRLRRHARLAQDATGRPGACRERHEQPVLRHEAVAGLLRGLLRGVERADDLRRELRLPGAAAIDARQLGELRVDRGGGTLRVAAMNVTALLREARNAATASGRSTTVVAAGGVVRATSSGGTVNMPPGSTAEPIGAAIRFTPDGRASGGPLTLASESSAFVIGANPDSGAIDVSAR